MFNRPVLSWSLKGSKMNTQQFKQHSKNGVQTLVDRVLKGRTMSEMTFDGHARNTVLALTNLPEDTWERVRSPTHIAESIPGLREFSCNHRAISEMHNMYYSINKYAGELFLNDQQRKIWGMTNHPVVDDNFFDIPHNTVYSFQKNNLIIGVQFAATGRVMNTVLSPLANHLADYSIQFALGRVQKEIQRYVQ